MRLNMTLSVIYTIYFYTHECNFHPHSVIAHAECDFHTQVCRFDTYECDFDTLVCDIYKQSVISKRILILTRTNVTTTLATVT
jgi:hypothetical protein